MSNDSSPNADQNLLARLNALKRSTVSFQQANNLPQPAAKKQSVSPDPAPARALGADLLSRWKTLGGGPSEAHPINSATSTDKLDDEKTVEELLADLGPSDAWDIPKSEKDQVADLLQSAKSALEATTSEEGDKDISLAENNSFTRLSAIDVSAFQPEPESDEDAGQPGAGPRQKDNVNDEADELLARILDEVKHEPPPPYEDHEQPPEHEDAPSGDDAEQHHDVTSALGRSGLDLPTTPSKLPDPVVPTAESNQDEDLASRFAGLSLPSVPTGMKSAKPSTPAKPSAGFTDEDIDTWCIICNDDATVRCIGCDGDLFCNNCWMEGHRGEDAGMEERKHKAVQYVKGGGKKKVPKRKVMMGA